MAASGSRMRAIGCRSASRSRPRRFLPRQARLCDVARGPAVGRDPHECQRQPREQQGLVQRSVLLAGLAAVDAHDAVSLHQRVLRVPEAGDDGQSGQADVLGRQHCAGEHDGAPGEGASAKVEVAFVAVDQGEGEWLVRERDEQRRRHQPRGAVRVVSEQPSGGSEWDPTERQRDVAQPTAAMGTRESGDEDCTGMTVAVLIGPLPSAWWCSASG